MPTVEFDFDATVRAIMDTQEGQERNMYVYLHKLFVNVLGYESGDIVIDSAQEGSGGNRPDLIARAGTGIIDKKGREVFHDWIVGEVKDERDAFSKITSRECIFAEKSKYIKLGTEWFLMIDPCVLVVRPVAMRSQTHFDSSKDIEMKWENLTEKTFLDKLSLLRADNAVDSPALRGFRAGDESRIAVVVVDLPETEKNELKKDERERLKLAKGDFLDTIRSGTKMLQQACNCALAEWEKEIGDMERLLLKFKERWDEYDLCFDPVAIRGKNINGAEEKAEHEKHAKAVKKAIKANIAVAKLAARALPAYYRRSGREDKSPFAAESANLVLARILLLRFFEDHNFFGNKKYVCNGGVKVLQGFMKHHERGYALVLEAAYEKGEKIYAEAFDKTDLDWVLKCDNLQVSRAVELTMMYLSRFNFSTVSGDILTGIYDRFLDKWQRKAMGEFYTPPSIARYIVQRFNIQPEHSVFDPACGSGTFLLEAFAQMSKGDVQHGRGDYKQAAAVLANIGGNDINPFSAIMAQIQMLWHLLPLKTELKQEGFPDIRIADGVNSIVMQDLLLEGRSASIYADLDQKAHDFVIGNPPYVRPERSGELDAKTEEFYDDIGGAKKNFYDLFVYKALSSWCRPAENGQVAGRLGFVLPLSFCDSGSSAKLRKLFALGGKFRLLEIVDMEVIAPLVFDAAVNPILLLAENRAARADDEVIVRVAGDNVVVDEITREFDISRASINKFKYADLWTADGCILTKITAQRKKITDKMAAADQTLESIARVFWVGKKGTKIHKWQTLPADGELMGGDSNTQTLRWEPKIMLGRGATERRKSRTATDNNGMDFYKGENISGCLIEGEPTKTNLVPGSLSDSSFWKYRDILPTTGYAFLRITLGITAARFNPQQHAFLDTATLLFPNEEWKNFPLDAVLLSRLYQFYYALCLREGAMSHSFRSHVYPRNLRRIPFPSALRSSAERLTELRAEFLRLCENTANRSAALSSVLQQVGAIELRIACRKRNVSIQWSENLREGDEAKIAAPSPKSCVVQKDADGWLIKLNDEQPLLSGYWMNIADVEIAKCLAAALTIYNNITLNRQHLLKILIPANKEALAKFILAAAEYDAGGDHKKLKVVLDEIDEIAGAAFGLSQEQIAYIQKEMREDTFLQKIHPNLPYSDKRKRGLLSGLESSERYAQNGTI